MIFQNCLKFHSPITAREREITSDNFEIQPQIMLLPMQMPIKFLYMSALQPFVYTFRENVALWVKYQEEITPLCLLELRRGVWGGRGGGWGKATKVLTNDQVVYSRGSLRRVLLQHTTPWGQLIHWPLTYQWTSKKILDQVRPSGKLPTYASPNSTLTLTSQDKIFWLGEG